MLHNDGSKARSGPPGSSLDLGRAAIEIKLDSGNVTRFVRCLEENSLAISSGPPDLRRGTFLLDCPSFSSALRPYTVPKLL